MWIWQTIAAAHGLKAGGAAHGDKIQTKNLQFKEFKMLSVITSTYHYHHHLYHVSEALTRVTVWRHVAEIQESTATPLWVSTHTHTLLIEACRAARSLQPISARRGQVVWKWKNWAESCQKVMRETDSQRRGEREGEGSHDGVITRSYYVTDGSWFSVLFPTRVLTFKWKLYTDV